MQFNRLLLFYKPPAEQSQYYLDLMGASLGASSAILGAKRSQLHQLSHHEKQVTRSMLLNQQEQFKNFVYRGNLSENMNAANANRFGQRIYMQKTGTGGYASAHQGHASSTVTHPSVSSTTSRQTQAPVAQQAPAAKVDQKPDLKVVRDGAPVETKNLQSVGDSVKDIDSLLKRDKSGKIKSVKGSQSHHVVSDKHPRTMDHPLWDLAGMTPENPLNKMLLPTKKGAAELWPNHKDWNRSIHDGKHLGIVNENLAAKMNAAEQFGQLNNWNQQQYANALKDIIKEERQFLKTGERMLNKNCRPNAVPIEKPGK